MIGTPLAALLSSPLKFLVRSPVGMATVTAGMYCLSKYATGIGVRTDVVKVALEDLAGRLVGGIPNDRPHMTMQFRNNYMSDNIHILKTKYCH